MAYRLADDPRVDPGLRKLFGTWDVSSRPDVGSREELLQEESTPAARRRAQAMVEFFDSLDSEEIAPSAGLTFRDERVQSQPDGNFINIRITRPATDQVLPCVYYIHGGAMQILSCYNGHYRTWARLIAARGVAVAMVDFRNALLPSSVAQVAPYPAGLNDCVSGLDWLHANSAALRIDPRGIIVAGDSGGGNLALATGLRLKRDGRLGLIKGLYALCPFIAGRWPRAENPSSIENNGILMDTHNNRAAMAYGIEALRQRDPLAWPGFAVEADVRGLPPVIISVNELDPLRDEGVNFFRLLLKSGVAARCRQNIGTTHSAETFPQACPDISRDTARDIATFARY
jgi:acetyl esterase/lipase